MSLCAFFLKKPEGLGTDKLEEGEDDVKSCLVKKTEGEKKPFLLLLTQARPHGAGELRLRHRVPHRARDVRRRNGGSPLEHVHPRGDRAPQRGRVAHRVVLERVAEARVDGPRRGQRLRRRGGGRRSGSVHGLRVARGRGRAASLQRASPARPRERPARPLRGAGNSSGPRRSRAWWRRSGGRGRRRGCVERGREVTGLGEKEEGVRRGRKC